MIRLQRGFFAACLACSPALSIVGVTPEKVVSVVFSDSRPHVVVGRSAEVSVLGVDSAQQIIAEVGVSAATFSVAQAPRVLDGVCPGNEESAGVNCSRSCDRSR